MESTPYTSGQLYESNPMVNNDLLLKETHTYIMVEKSSGLAVLELFSTTLLSKINQDKYTIMTAYDYLCQLNKRIKENNGKS